MKRIIFPIVSALVLAAGFLGADGLYQYAEAQGEAAKVAELDAGAGPTVDIGSADTVEIHLDGAGPVVAPPVPSDGIDDPTKAPVAAWDDVKAAKKTGWTMVLLVVLIMALRGLGYVKGLAFFKRDRVAIVIGGALTVATSLFDTLVLGGTWVAAMYAAATAVAIWWRSKHAVVAPVVSPS